MARTLGCADVGYECVYRITANDGDEDFMVSTTIKHVEEYHPELMGDLPELSETLKRTIKNLLDQSNYNKQERSAPSA